MAFLSANLLARFCRRIDICIASGIRSKIHFPKIREDELHIKILNLCRAINPFGIFRTKKGSLSRYEVALTIGNSPIKANRTISINSDGWIAYANINQHDLNQVSENQNPIGAQIAACFGVSEVFKAVLSNVPGCNPRDVKPSNPITFSGFDYTLNGSIKKNPSLPSSIPIGEIHLLGAGAIGCAVAHSLFSTPGIEGNIILIDPEVIETSNLNRYVLATTNDLRYRKAKVELVKEFSTPQLKVQPFCKRYQDYVNQEGDSGLDLVAVTVDDYKTHWDVQNDFPHIILNGATEIGYVRISRHDDFLRKTCLGCLYQAPAPKGGSYPTPSISFVSTLAGVLIAAEIIKEKVQSFHGASLDNQLDLNCLKVLETTQVRKPLKSSSCGCKCSDPQILKAFHQKQSERRRLEN
jgi:molybdopterin/thiamine biosynthesis adenylyltransferase